MCCSLSNNLGRCVGLPVSEDAVTPSHKDDVVSLETVAAEDGAEVPTAASTMSRETQQSHVTQPPVVGASGRQGICTVGLY